MEGMGDTSRPPKWERGSERPQPFRGVGYVKIKTALRGLERWATKMTEPAEGRPRSRTQQCEVPDLLGERLIDALDDLEAIEDLIKRVLRMVDPAGTRYDYVRLGGARRSI